MRFKLAVTAAAATSMLVLAGCSSSSTATSSSPTPTTPAASTPAAPGTIVEVAAANPDFSTLVTAVKAAGLVDTLNSAGPFTVFAPTNAAFATLPAGCVDKLLLPENKDSLAKVLTYHVVPGTVLSGDVKAGPVKTVEGSDITITTDGGVKVNDIVVSAVDVKASNGVIHVIDGVLVPASVTVCS